MDYYGFVQLALFATILLLVTKPMGLYLVQLLDVEQKPFLYPVVNPLEGLFYRILNIDPKKEQDWKRYTISMMVFSLIGTLFTYSLLRLQYFLPLNPEGFATVAPDLSFNTAVSFATNTNWQNYGGESTLSYFSQMVGLTFQNFISAAVGMCTAAALVRGISRSSTPNIGNFWTDMVRVNLYLLIPLCLIYAVFLVSQGTVQNFKAYDTVQLINPYVVEESTRDGHNTEILDLSGDKLQSPRSLDSQRIVQGPVASQIAIKMLGTNGGGFTNANAAHPFENPTPLSNFFQMLSIFLVPSGLTYFLGRMVKDQRHGWSVWTAMAIIFFMAVTVCWWAESTGNPRFHAMGVDLHDGNMEGKEVRFGIFNSTLFATITTAASCGAVNSMHDSFTPVGGLITILNIQLGEVVFGGVGSGLYGMLIFVIMAVFLAGLMIGRTPEYLGKKIEAYDIKVSVLYIMVPVLTILGFTSWACVSTWALKAHVATSSTTD